MKKSIKHTLASRNDAKPTINNSEMIKLIGKNYQLDTVTLHYYPYGVSITYKSSRNGTTWYPLGIFPKNMILPQIGKPLWYSVSLSSEAMTPKVMELVNEFEPIRQWAEARNIYKKGDIKTQCLKLQEEVGELSRAILKENIEEIDDAIGDSVIVLTNLAKLCGTDIETCINNAYKVIAERKGQMINGTFVKNNG